MPLLLVLLHLVFLLFHPLLRLLCLVHPAARVARPATSTPRLLGLVLVLVLVPVPVLVLVLVLVRLRVRAVGLVLVLVLVVVVVLVGIVGIVFVVAVFVVVVVVFALVLVQLDFGARPRPQNPSPISGNSSSHSTRISTRAIPQHRLTICLLMWLWLTALPAAKSPSRRGTSASSICLRRWISPASS